MKIQNYGNWKGDKRGGHHPPACTCYRCNEQRLEEEAAQEEARRVAEYDRQVAGGHERAQANTKGRVTQDVGETAEADALDAPARKPPAPPGLEIWPETLILPKQSFS